MTFQEAIDSSKKYQNLFLIKKIENSRVLIRYVRNDPRVKEPYFTVNFDVDEFGNSSGWTHSLGVVTEEEKNDPNWGIFNSPKNPKLDLSPRFVLRFPFPIRIMKKKYLKIYGIEGCKQEHTGLMQQKTLKSKQTELF